MRHNRVLLQNGKGIGGIFRFISRMFIPVMRKVVPAVKTLAKTPSVKKGLKKIQNKAVESAMNSVVDLASGKSPKQRLQKDMSTVANIAKHAILDKKKRGKKRKKQKTFFGAKKFRKSVFDD